MESQHYAQTQANFYSRPDVYSTRTQSECGYGDSSEGSDYPNDEEVHTSSRVQFQSLEASPVHQLDPSNERQIHRREDGAGDVGRTGVTLEEHDQMRVLKAAASNAEKSETKLKVSLKEQWLRLQG